MKKTEITNLTCSIARAAGIVGDVWTLMLVRELFLGSRRYDEFQVYTGMSPHLLSRHLQRLQKEKIIKKTRYQDHPPRYEYHLTRKGVDLYPVIISLAQWGDRWEGDMTLYLIHKPCGHRTIPALVCSECKEPLLPWDMGKKMAPAMARERQAMWQNRKTKKTIEETLVE